MGTLLFLVVMSLVVLLDRTSDPSAGLFRGKQEARNLECLRLSQAEAHARYPVQVPEPPSKIVGAVTDALACQRLYLRENERPARDELLLSSLRQATDGIVAAAAAGISGDESVVWHVDAFYPDQTVAGKIASAAKTQMAERGLMVSDRVPLLAAGDIAVLGRMPPEAAYSVACVRYAAQGALADNHAFLSLMVVDAREGQLHAGFCRQGKWTWLQ